MKRYKREKKNFLINKLDNFIKTNFPQSISDPFCLYNAFAVMDLYIFRSLEFYNSDLNEAEIKRAFKFFEIRYKKIISDKKAYLNLICKNNLLIFLKKVIFISNKKKKFIEIENPNFSSYVRIINENIKKLLNKDILKAKKRVNDENRSKLTYERKKSNKIINCTLPSADDKHEFQCFESLKKIILKYGFVLKQKKRKALPNSVCHYNEEIKEIIALKEKASAFLKPNHKTISYNLDEGVKYKSIRKEVRLLDKIQFDFNCYKDFNMRDFICDILYSKNNLIIPTKKSYKFLKNYKELFEKNIDFINSFLPEEITNLILQQDEYLTVSEARLIADEFKYNLRIEDYEYFFNLYLNSNHSSKKKVKSSFNIVNK